MERPFAKQKGAYKVIERNRFIFIKKDLHPVMHDIVLLHEIGHDTLHRLYLSFFTVYAAKTSNNCCLIDGADG